MLSDNDIDKWAQIMMMMAIGMASILSGSCLLKLARGCDIESISVYLNIISVVLFTIPCILFLSSCVVIYYFRRDKNNE